MLRIIEPNTQDVIPVLVAYWRERTAQAVAGRHVLAIEDTTEVSFSTRARTPPGPRLA